MTADRAEGLIERLHRMRSAKGEAIRRDEPDREAELSGLCLRLWGAKTCHAAGR
jgi:hypothetical protein